MGIRLASAGVRGCPLHHGCHGHGAAGALLARGILGAMQLPPLPAAGNIFTKSRKALIVSTALMVFDLCYILSMFDFLSWICLSLITVGLMIVMLIFEGNGYLKLLNLITIVVMSLGLFKVSR